MKFGLRSPEGGCRKSLKKVINGSKFERLSHAEMASVKGGEFCISCMKRDRKVMIGSNNKGDFIIHIGKNWGKLSE